MQVKQFPTVAAAARAATVHTFPTEGLIWRAVGGKGKERSRLIASVSFAGCDFHLEAFQVRQVGHLQQSATPVGASVLALLSNAFGADGPLRTVSIEGLPYFVTMTPFAD